MKEIVDARPVDMQQERTAVIPMLCRKIYPELYDTFTQTNDKQHQFSGVDIVFPDGNHDAKAQMKTYINHPTETFCVEIISDGLTRDKATNKVVKRQRRLGWFVDESKVTDYYDFVWIPSAKTTKFGKDIIIEKPDDIYVMELMVVDAKKLQKYIYSIKSCEELLQMADDMRANNIESKYIAPGIKLYYSSTFQEHPVNLVIGKDIHKKFAKFHVQYDNGRIEHLMPKPVTEQHDEACPKCGAKVLLRQSNYGYYFACEHLGPGGCSYTRKTV